MHAIKVIKSWLVGLGRILVETIHLLRLKRQVRESKDSQWDKPAKVEIDWSGNVSINVIDLIRSKEFLYETGTDWDQDLNGMQEDQSKDSLRFQN